MRGGLDQLGSPVFALLVLAPLASEPESAPQALPVSVLPQQASDLLLEGSALPPLA